MEQGVWVAKAKYADGTTIEKAFIYMENGNYIAECQRQYDIVCWLIEAHDNCTWYSVDYVVDSFADGNDTIPDA